MENINEGYLSGCHLDLADYVSNKPALVKQLEYEGMQVPYDHLIEAFRCLYGSSCVIQFTATI